MRKLLTIFLMLTLISTLLLSTGCADTDIGEIKDNATEFEGKQVTVEGTVTNSFWLAILARGAYEITDNTSSIWVVTSHTPPENDEEVRVRGTVESAVRIGDRSLGTVIVEERRG